MYRPPLRGRPTLADKKVLLIDRLQATREARAAVLRSHGVEVHEAERFSTARFLWQPNVYDLVMLDVRRYSSEETREFYEQIRAADPRQQIVFLTGPPKYVSRTWPGEIAEGEHLAWTVGRDGQALSSGCLKPILEATNLGLTPSG